MHKSSEENLPIVESGGPPNLAHLSFGDDFKVLSTEELDFTNGFDIPGASDKPTWSTEVAFLSSSVGLDEWKSFTATRELSLSSTADKLPKLALLDLDSAAVMPVKKTADDFENGQTIPTEPPKVTDPLPPPPPGLKATLPSPDTPIFAIPDPDRSAPPDMRAEPDKRGLGPEDPDDIPTDPPKITDPLPSRPPGHERIIDTTPTPTPSKSGRSGNEPPHTEFKSRTAPDTQRQPVEKKTVEHNALSKTDDKDKDKLEDKDKDKHKDKDKDGVLAVESLRKLLAQRANLGIKPLAKKQDAPPKVVGLNAEQSRESQPDVPAADTQDLTTRGPSSKTRGLVATSLPLDDSIPQSVRTRQLLAGVGRTIEGSVIPKAERTAIVDDTTNATTLRIGEQSKVAQDRGIEDHTVHERGVQEQEVQEKVIQSRYPRERIISAEEQAPAKVVKADTGVIDFSPHRISEKNRILARVSAPIESEADRIKPGERRTVSYQKAERTATAAHITALETVAEGQSKTNKQATILPSLKIYKQVTLARSLSETPQDYSRYSTLPEKSVVRGLDQQTLNQPIVAGLAELPTVSRTLSANSRVELKPLKDISTTAGELASNRLAQSLHRSEIHGLVFTLPVRRQLSSKTRHVSPMHREFTAQTKVVSQDENVINAPLQRVSPRLPDAPAAHSSEPQNHITPKDNTEANDEHAKSITENQNLRITYIHIGNRIFLLERKLVQKHPDTEKQDQLPLELAATGTAAAAVIAGKRMRRRRKRDDAEITSGSNEPDSKCENAAIDFSESQRFLREAASIVRAASRYKYMIQPGDTLTSLALTLWQDEDLAWLIADVNNLTHTWQVNECKVSLTERQIIDLPLPEEVVEFYRSSKNVLYKNQKLVTVLAQTSIDAEISGAAYGQNTETFAPEWVQPAGQIGIMTDNYCPQKPGL